MVYAAALLLPCLVQGDAIRSMQSACSDQAITLAAIAPFADSPTTITGIGHIHFQESDRIAGMAAELTRMGIRCEERADSITVYPGSPMQPLCCCPVWFRAMRLGRCKAIRRMVQHCEIVLKSLAAAPGIGDGDAGAAQPGEGEAHGHAVVLIGLHGGRLRGARIDGDAVCPYVYRCRLKPGYRTCIDEIRAPMLSGGVLLLSAFLTRAHLHG